LALLTASSAPLGAGAEGADGVLLPLDDELLELEDEPLLLDEELLDGVLTVSFGEPFFTSSGRNTGLQATQPELSNLGLLLFAFFLYLGSCLPL
jgi:hypothetical protein